MDELTARELEIARLTAEGLESSGIARQLGIAPGTLRNHFNNIYRKIDVPAGHNKRVWLARYYMVRKIKSDKITPQDQSGD